MGVGGFLSAQAERSHYRYHRYNTQARVKRSCTGELQREVTDILGVTGLDEAVCRQAAISLMRIEGENVYGSANRSIHGSQSLVSALKHLWNYIMSKESFILREEERNFKSIKDDVGLTAFLIKFGDGLQDIPSSRLWTSALTIGFSYAIGGLVPLIPYLIVKQTRTALFWSIGVTAIVLMIFGSLKTYYSTYYGFHTSADI